MAFNIQEEVEKDLSAAPPEGRTMFLDVMAKFLDDCLSMKATGSVDGISSSSQQNLHDFVLGDEKALIILEDEILVYLERDRSWGINISQVIVRNVTKH